MQYCHTQVRRHGRQAGRQAGQAGTAGRQAGTAGRQGKQGKQGKQADTVRTYATKGVVVRYAQQQEGRKDGRTEARAVPPSYSTEYPLSLTFSCKKTTPFSEFSYEKEEAVICQDRLGTNLVHGTSRNTKGWRRVGVFRTHRVDLLSERAELRSDTIQLRLRLLLQLLRVLLRRLRAHNDGLELLGLERLLG
jgi:hypothetical protein